MHNLWVLFIYFFLLIMLPSEIPKLPTDPPVRGFPGVCKLLLLQDSLPGMGLHPQLFCLSFYLLYFVLPPFKDNMLTLSVPGILHQHSEVVLWNLLSVQISFNEFVGEKVISPSYSSTILGLLPPTDYLLCSQNGEALYSQQKQHRELTVAQIMNSLLPNSHLN